MPSSAENPTFIHPASTPGSPTTSESPTIADPNEQHQTATTEYDGSDDEDECEVCIKNGRLSKGDPTAEELEKALHGWPALAELISKRPEYEAFPAFRELNVKSLLYYQAELIELQEKLHKCEWEDHTQRKFHSAGRLNAYLPSLRLCKGSKEGGAHNQLDLIEEIRVVLEKYNAALLQYYQINALPRADCTNVKQLSNWIEDPLWGEDIIRDCGSKSWHSTKPDKYKNMTPKQQFWHVVRTFFWPDEIENDGLDVLCPRADKKIDGLARWVSTEFIPWRERRKEEQRAREVNGEEQPPPWWKRRFYFGRNEKDKQDEEQLPSAVREKRNSDSKSTFPTLTKSQNDNIFPFKMTPGNSHDGYDDEGKGEKLREINTYRGSRILGFTSIVATLVACLLPIVAISVLSIMHRTSEILGFIALFTALFALGLMFLTEAGTSRTEIFTATAAFSAVLVVFVQNQSPNVIGTG